MSAPTILHTISEALDSTSISTTTMDLPAQSGAQEADRSDHLPTRSNLDSSRLPIIEPLCKTASQSPRATPPPDLHLSTAPPWASAKISQLYSPCFFHKRFNDAVNLDKIVAELQEGWDDEEKSEDSTISHSKLMQTAIGVRAVGQELSRRPIKRAVKNVLIVTKARDNELVHLTKELAEWLLETPRNGGEVGVNVYVDAKLRSSSRFAAADILKKDPRFETMLRYWTPDLCWRSPEKFDLVLTLGGDGTVLYTSWLFQRIVPPVLSFSLGSLGFLTPFPFQRFREALDTIMGDAGMRVNLRMRFTCTVFRAQKRVKGRPQSPAIESEQFEVLNEVLVDRGPSPYVSSLELYGDDDLLTVVQADGCIFSTPTGSTAYSLSAGGSLVHPDIPAILLTPICPHSLSFRPMLLNDTMALRVAVPKGSRATAHCAFDGKNRVELRQGDYVTIVASKYPFPTVVSRGTEWFDSISKTLRWNNRGAMQKGWGGHTKRDRVAKEGIAEDAEDTLPTNADVSDDHDSDEEDEDEEEGHSEGEPEAFDIDFDDDEKDSTYSTGESSINGTAGPSPRKGRIPTWASS